MIEDADTVVVSVRCKTAASDAIVICGTSQPFLPTARHHRSFDKAVRKFGQARQFDQLRPFDQYCGTVWPCRSSDRWTRLDSLIRLDSFTRLDHMTSCLDSLTSWLNSLTIKDRMDRWTRLVWPSRMDLWTRLASYRLTSWLVSFIRLKHLTSRLGGVISRLDRLTGLVWPDWTVWPGLSGQIGPFDRACLARLNRLPTLVWSDWTVWPGLSGQIGPFDQLPKQFSQAGQLDLQACSSAKPLSVWCQM